MDKAPTTTPAISTNRWNLALNEDDRPWRGRKTFRKSNPCMGWGRFKPSRGDATRSAFDIIADCPTGIEIGRKFIKINYRGGAVLDGALTTSLPWLSD